MSLEVTPYRRVNDLDVKLDQVQDAVSDSLNSIAPKQILAGHILNVNFSGAGAKLITHGLGRNIIGWIVIDKDAVADVYRTNKDNPKSFLNLTASAAVNLKLWVF